MGKQDPAQVLNQRGNV